MCACYQIYWCRWHSAVPVCVIGGGAVTTLVRVYQGAETAAACSRLFTDKVDCRPPCL